MEVTENDQWDIVIEAKKKGFGLNLSEIWKYRDLFLMYIKRDIVVIYKQTILGPLWFIIQPIFTTITFMFIGNIANISTDGLPQILFYMAGIVCWNYFAESLNKTSNTFLANANIFSKVYFPRLVVPLSIVTSNLVKFFIQFGLFIVIYLYYIIFKGIDVAINSYVLLFPFLIMMLAALAFGFGIIVSSLTTKYRDLSMLFAFVVQLWMYVTPVIYPLSVMEGKYEKWMWLLQLNPITSIIEAFKYGFLGAGTFTWTSLGYSALFTIFIFLVGSWMFNKVERSFIDVV